MRKKAKIAQNIFFIIGFIILGVMIYKIGFDVIWNYINQVGWWFIPILSLWIIAFLINTLAFIFILRDGDPNTEKLSFMKLCKITVSGNAINHITPFGLMGGEPYKILELQPTLGIEKATSSVLLSTMMRFVAHFIFWIVSIPLLFFLVPVVSDSVEIGIMISGGTTFLLLLWAYRVYTKGGVDRALMISGRLPFVGRRIRAYRMQHKSKIEHMDTLIADLYQNRKKDFITSLLLELSTRFITCIEVVFMMQAIGSPITYGQSVIIESIQSLISNLFFFMPMQLGAREGGFAVVFGILSMPLALGVFVSLCNRIREIFWTFTGILLIKVGRN